MPVPRPSAIARHPGVALITHGDLGIVVWVGDPTLAANQWLVNHALREVAGTHDSFLVLQLIAPSAGTPDAEARQFVQEAFRTRLGNVRRMVTVPLGDTLSQSIVRTIMRGMIILSGKSQSMSVASSIDEGLKVLIPLSSPDTPSRREVLADVRVLFDDLRVKLPVPPF